jgi:hypothetical protein
MADDLQAHGQAARVKARGHGDRGQATERRQRHYLHGDGLAQCRIFSKVLALQIKARELGIVA